MIRPHDYSHPSVLPSEPDAGTTAGGQQAEATAERTAERPTRKTRPLTDVIGRAKSVSQVDEYNFKQPRIFSQDQVRLLNYVHDAFARGLSVYLSNRLRTIVEVRLEAIEQLSYADYVTSCDVPSALYVTRASNTEHSAVFEVDPRFILFLLDKQLGGSGEFPENRRAVSPIEQRLMGRLLNRAYTELSTAWGEIATMKFEETAFETIAEFVQIVPGTEPVLVARLKLVAYGHECFMNVCYPYLLLKQVLGRTGIKQWLARSRGEMESALKEIYEKELGESKVELRMELGEARIPLTELLSLEVGDVIPLDRRASDDISVYIGSREYCKARLGRVGKYQAIGITELVNQYDNGLDGTD